MTRHLLIALAAALVVGSVTASAQSPVTIRGTDYQSADAGIIRPIITDPQGRLKVIVDNLSDGGSSSSTPTNGQTVTQNTACGTMSQSFSQVVTGSATQLNYTVKNNTGVPVMLSYIDPVCIPIVFDGGTGQGLRLDDGESFTNEYGLKAGANLYCRACQPDGGSYAVGLQTAVTSQ